MKKAGDLLSAFFNDHFDKVSLENGRMTAGLFSSWAEAAKAVNISVAADHSRVRELEHKVLVIEAEHPGWVQLLQTKQKQLLKYVQGKFPELGIQGISFCLSRELISHLENTYPVEAIQDSASKPAASETCAESSSPSENSSVSQSLNEPIKEFKNIIEKRNKR
jgi:hypothetical protein